MCERKHAVLDRFVPEPDEGGRHEITIHAPAELVMEVARNIDIESIWMIRALFWLRGKLLGVQMEKAGPRAGLIEQMLGLGWGCLAEEQGRYFVAGAACKPWQANPGFSAIAPEQFVSYAQPDEVKIAWTLEAEALGPELTRFGTETRVVATDEEARKKFRWYWRRFGIGIVLIRKILLPVVRRQSERQWKALRGEPLSPHS